MPTTPAPPAPRQLARPARVLLSLAVAVAVPALAVLALLGDAGRVVLLAAAGLLVVAVLRLSREGLTALLLGLLLGAAACVALVGLAVWALSGATLG